MNNQDTNKKKTTTEKKKTDKKAIVVWWWFWGLASAILLSREGFSVTLYEKNEQVWGRASVREKDWFKRDMWPSRYLMPDVFKQFFEEIWEKVEDHLDLTKLDPSYKVFFTDKGKEGEMTIYSDPERDVETLEKFEPWVRKQFFRYLKKAEYQYEIWMKFVRKNYDSILDFMTPELALKWMQLNVFTTFTRYVSRFFTHPRLKKIMMYPLVFLGTDPSKAPALYNIMSHVDFNMWVFYPQGWIRAIVEALISIAEKNGVTIHTNVPVTRILIDEKTKAAIWIEYESWWEKSWDMWEVSSTWAKLLTDHADVVVVNADMAWAETTLLPEKYQTYKKSYRDKKEYAPSAFLVYLGINKKLPNIEHHTLLFNEDRKETFDEIFEHKRLPADPSLYLCTPSKTDPAVAPEGKENMFILVPIPCDVDIPQDQEDAYKKKVYDLIEDACDISFQDDILVEKVFHVKDFKQRYNAFQWTALWLSHKLLQTAIFRPNNYSKKLSWLYYVWHHTNPGIGMPMVLISAQLMLQRVLKKYI